MKKCYVIASGILILALTTISLAYNQQGSGAKLSPLFNSDPATCSDGALSTSGSTFGFVILNTNANGEVIAQVSVRDGVPDTTYSIWINQDPGDCPTLPTATLTTNGHGNGEAHVVKARLSAATRFWVSAQEEPYAAGKQILRSIAVALD
jgi:hypothetical protein